MTDHSKSPVLLACTDEANWTKSILWEAHYLIESLTCVNFHFTTLFATRTHENSLISRIISNHLNSFHQWGYSADEFDQYLFLKINVENIS